MKPDVNASYVLSDGEGLAMMGWERLIELGSNINKLASKLGRSRHYAKKNRSNLDILSEDYDLVQLEIRRRYALTTLSLCGVIYHYCGEDTVVGIDSGTITPLYKFEHYNDAYRTFSGNKLNLTKDQLQECVLRGGILTTIDDPCGPLKVAGIDGLERGGGF